MEVVIGCFIKQIAVSVFLAWGKGVEPLFTVLETAVLPFTPTSYMWRRIRDLNPWPPAWQAGVLLFWTNTPFIYPNLQEGISHMDYRQLRSSQNHHQQCTIMCACVFLDSEKCNIPFQIWSCIKRQFHNLMLEFSLQPFVLYQLIINLLFAA
mgnify:CR=1 FL=1